MSALQYKTPCNISNEERHISAFLSNKEQLSNNIALPTINPMTIFSVPLSKLDIRSNTLERCQKHCSPIPILILKSTSGCTLKWPITALIVSITHLQIRQKRIVLCLCNFLAVMSALKELPSTTQCRALAVCMWSTFKIRDNVNRTISLCSCYINRFIHCHWM